MSGENPAQVAVPLQEPTSAATELQTLLFLIEQRLLRVQTVTAVKVLAVHGGGVGPVGTVDVLPLVNQVDGAGSSIPHVTLYNRPYVRWQGGANAFILDPVAGDIGLMVFASRDLSAVITSKGPGVPPSRRKFNYADGIYVGGILNGTPTAYVQFATNGDLNIVAPAVNITTTSNVNINGAIITPAGEVKDALGKVLGTHTHSGVQPGGGTSGPPT